MSKLLKCADLLAADFPPGKFHIDNGLLPENGMMVIGGPPKTYKSFILKTMMTHLTTGTALFGAHRKPHGRIETVFNIPRPLKVLYLEQEIGAGFLKERLGPMVAALPRAHQDLVKENLYVYSCDAALQFDTTEGRDKFNEIFNTCRPDVVCFDPLIEFHTRDENDTQQMAAVFRVLDRFRQHYSFSSIIAHHTGKPSQLHREGPDLLRGNSVIFGKGDAYLMLKPINRNMGAVQISFTIRQGAPLDDLNILLDWTDLRAKFHSWGKFKGAVSRDSEGSNRVV